MADFEERKSIKSLWVAAAVIAVALHVGGAALALMHLQPDEDDEGLGAAVSAIGVELVAPNVEKTDLPPGPDAEQTAASPAQAEQQAEAKPTDLPKDKPTEPDEADRVVTEHESKKPTEDDPKIEAAQATASDPAIAQEAAAPQPIDGAKVADLPAAPNPGLGNDKGELTKNWMKKISGIFEKNKRYPKVHKGKAANVTVSFVLNRLGRVVQLAIAESSGDPSYDEEALAMVRRSDPELPPPPAERTEDTFSYNILVKFNKPKS